MAKFKVYTLKLDIFYIIKIYERKRRNEEFFKII